MTCPQPSHGLEVLGLKGHPAFSIAVWVGEMRQTHSAGPLIFFLPKRGFISAPSHLLGLPNFPSMNYVEQKMLKWGQIPFSETPSFHKSIAEGGIAQEYTCEIHTCGQNSIFLQGPHKQAF